MAVALSAMDAALARTRRRIALSASLALVGIGWSTVGDATLGGFVTVSAVASLVWNLHRFGRSGPS